MSCGGWSAEPEAIEEILHYFTENPHAADGLEGIIRWRLLHERVHQRLEETRAAVEWLVARGYLLQETSPLSGPIFRLNDAEREGIEQLLRKGLRRRNTSCGKSMSSREP